MNQSANETIRGWPAHQIERWPIGRLVPYARNARTHSDAQVDLIAASIVKWGWTMPILASEEGTILSGYGRFLAAGKLGLAEVPVVVARGWTEEQKAAYVIADNQIGLRAGWDEGLLRLELGALQAAGFELAPLGFDAAELAGILDVRPAGATDPDEAPEPPVNPVAVRGDFWALGRHRLICGDATSVEDTRKVLDGAAPQLMITDPPYGVNYDPAWRESADLGVGKRSKGRVANDNRTDWSKAWALFPGQVAYVWHAGLHCAVVQQSLESQGFAMRAQIIWVKQHFVLSRGDYHWQHEPCWYAVRDKGHWIGDRKQTTIWDIRNNNCFGNADKERTWGLGAQKPVECMKRPIENNSSPGLAVYDPFLGTGTTLIAAEMTGRSCYGLEIDPAYCDVIINRWQNFTGGKATLDGLTFAEVKDARCGLHHMPEQKPVGASDLSATAAE
jgi:DNA modification methylase